MPKREDIKTILVIGSGPIVIGQACEFDYSGAQACKVLVAQAQAGPLVQRVQVRAVEEHTYVAAPEDVA